MLALCLGHPLVTGAETNLSISASPSSIDIRHKEWKGNLWRYILPEHIFVSDVAPPTESSAPYWSARLIELNGVTTGEDATAYRITMRPGVNVLDIDMTLTNKSERSTMPSTFAVLCFRHIGARDFIDIDRGGTFIHVDGEFVAVKDTDPNFEHSGHLLRQEDLKDASASERETYLDNRPLADASLIVRTSRDGKRHVGIAWESARSVSYNLDERYNCNHSQPRFGSLEPGQSAVVRGRVYFFEGTREDLFEIFKRDFAEVGYAEIEAFDPPAK